MQKKILSELKVKLRLSGNNLTVQRDIGPHHPSDRALCVGVGARAVGARVRACCAYLSLPLNELPNSEAAVRVAAERDYLGCTTFLQRSGAARGPASDLRHQPVALKPPLHPWDTPLRLQSLGDFMHLCKGSVCVRGVCAG